MMALLEIVSWSGLGAASGFLAGINVSEGDFRRGAALGLAAVFSVAALGYNAYQSNEIINELIEDQFKPDEPPIEQGEFNQESPQSLYDSIGSEVQKAYEARGGEKKLTFSCGLK